MSELSLKLVCKQGTWVGQGTWGGLGGAGYLAVEDELWSALLELHAPDQRHAIGFMRGILVVVVRGHQELLVLERGGAGRRGGEVERTKGEREGVRGGGEAYCWRGVVRVGKTHAHTHSHTGPYLWGPVKTGNDSMFGPALVVEQSAQRQAGPSRHVPVANQKQGQRLYGHAVKQGDGISDSPTIPLL